MKLKEIRTRIDTLDRELVQILDSRMELGLRAKKLKDQVADPDREQVVIRNVIEGESNLLESKFKETLFQSIVDESRRLQEEDPKLVAFQGEHGAYGDVASRGLVPDSVYVPCLEFSDVFEGVAQGLFDLGVVPVENSLEGAVTQVNDLLMETDLKVVGEASIPIHHCLLAPSLNDYREIRVVYSHPQALAQCRGFLSRNRIEPRPYYDTAGAAQMISRDRPRAAAAIASSLSAKLYGLEILKEEIEDADSNSTRFLLVAKEPEAEDGNKCSVTFVAPHQAGALHEVLRLFAEAEINLTRIASLPIRTDPGNYTFFLDFEGSDQDDKIKKTLAEVKTNTTSLRFLGCYRSA
jgi:prephenate dehydratase/chorismate mutase